MLIRIAREPRQPNAANVIGTLTIEARPATPTADARAALELVTMEPPIREDGLFIPGESGLPATHYNLSIDYCRRFKAECPLLVAMPANLERRASHFRLGMWIHHGIRVHESTTDIVLGLYSRGRTVLRTVEAYEALMREIRFAKSLGEAIEVQIT